MGDFFQGWRRKAGLATLATALLLMVGWMRSSVVRDQIVVQFEEAHCILESRRGGIAWESMNQVFDDMPTIQWFSDDGLTPSTADFVRGSPYRVWKWEWGGVVLGSNTNDIDSHDSYGVIPYWSLVLPLTLLSAWLLLIKPRPAKSAKESSRA